MARVPRLFQTRSWGPWKKSLGCRVGIILGWFSFLYCKWYIVCTIRIASMRRFEWEHTTYLHVIEKQTEDILIMPPDLALTLTFISSNYCIWKAPMGRSRKENPQKLTQLSSRSHPRHLVGKRTAQKDTIIDITSDRACLTFLEDKWICVGSLAVPETNIIQPRQILQGRK